MIHAGGLSLTEGDTKGVGISLGGSLGFGVAKTTAATQTALSAVAQPPSKKKISGWALLGILMAFGMVSAGSQAPDGVGQVAAGVIIFALLCYYIYRVLTFNSREFPQLQARWERSYMCERCGTVVVL